MKKIVAGISALLLLASAVVFANGSSVKKADWLRGRKLLLPPGKYLLQ